MHIWGGLWEAFGIPSHSTGRQGRPRPDICNPKHKVTYLCEGGLDAKWTPCSPQSVHQPIYGQMHAILSSLEEEWSRFPLERGKRYNLSRIEEVSNFTTHAVKVVLMRDVISLPRRLGVRCEQSLSFERWGRLEASVLHQPLHETQTRYQKVEKLVLALLIISRKLKHYFQTFPISPHRPPPEERREKPGSNQEDIKMGLRAEILRT